jgi:hypothetical protein
MKKRTIGMDYVSMDTSELEARAQARDREAIHELLRRGVDEAIRRVINAKGPFHCPCPDRVFEDIDAYMEHCRVLHTHWR